MRIAIFCLVILLNALSDTSFGADAKWLGLRLGTLSWPNQQVSSDEPALDSQNYVQYGLRARSPLWGQILNLEGRYDSTLNKKADHNKFSTSVTTFMVGTGLNYKRASFFLGRGMLLVKIDGPESESEEAVNIDGSTALIPKGDVESHMKASQIGVNFDVWGSIKTYLDLTFAGGWNAVAGGISYDIL